MCIKSSSSFDEKYKRRFNSAILAGFAYENDLLKKVNKIFILHALLVPCYTIESTIGTISPVLCQGCFSCLHLKFPKGIVPSFTGQLVGQFIKKQTIFLHWIGREGLFSLLIRSLNSTALNFSFEEILRVFCHWCENNILIT